MKKDDSIHPSSTLSLWNGKLTMVGCLSQIARISTWIAGGLLILCSVLIAVEVIVRKIFSTSIGGVDEMTSYVFAVGVAWSFAFTILGRAHIRIDVVYAHCPLRVRAILDLLSLLAVLVVGGLLLERAAATALTSFEISARSNTPLGVTLWIPQALWALGLAFFVLVVIALLSAATRLVLRRDLRAAGLLAGIRTIDEEVRDET
jgi:TRAP-type mannitol/chloroaromatic compound transport system permease small subunit